MIRLQEIVLERTLAVEVKCSVNESVIDKNFEVIMGCLKDIGNTSTNLQEGAKTTSERTDKCEKDIQKILRQLASLTAKLDLPKDPPRLRVSASSNKKQANLQLQEQVDAGDLEALRRRLEEESQRNKKNNIQNLKDINLLHSDVKEIKKRLDRVDGKVSFSYEEGQSAGRSGTESEAGGQNLEHTRIVQNEMQRQLDLINKLFSELDSLKNSGEKQETRLNKLEGDKLNSTFNSVSAAGVSSGFANSSDQDNLKSRFEQYDHSLERLGIIEQKLRLLPNSDDNDNNLAELRTWIGEVEETANILQEEIENMKNKAGGESVDQSRPVSTPRTEGGSRKSKQIEMQHDNEHKWLRETLKDAVIRIEDLERILRESKDRLQITSLKEIEDGSKGDGKTDPKQKLLPNINKRSHRLKRDSQNNTLSRNDYGSKEHNGLAREGGTAASGQRPYDFDKKMFQIKGDLQQWVKQLLESRNLGATKRDDEFYKDLELKIQELRTNVERKADHEGMRKYLTFLENKINQLFMVLAQPESEDALIARKGWGCLSCAKKLEKYKGRLGEHLNWNNFTHANYSPPKIGFTQTQAVIRPQRGKFTSNDKSFAHDEQHSHYDL